VAVEVKHHIEATAPGQAAALGHDELPLRNTRTMRRLESALHRDDKGKW
jgi:hypothetical protein